MDINQKGLLFFDQVEDILDNSPAKKLFGKQVCLRHNKK